MLNTYYPVKLEKIDIFIKKFKLYYPVKLLKQLYLSGVYTIILPITHLKLNIAVIYN